MIVVRISEVKMQKNDSDKNAMDMHHKVKVSTTLNRRYVRKPVLNTDMVMSVKRSPKVEHFNDAMLTSDVSKMEWPMEPVTMHRMQVSANEKMSAMKQKEDKAVKMTAKELKDQAIQKALASANKTVDNDTTSKKNKKRKVAKVHFGLGRVVLALSCAAAAVFAIVYFVNLNMPDISMRVAAMQTGIDASYPGYVPRGFSLSDITSENGKIVLNFKNASTGDAFSLIEEQSSWDSNALLTNFVKDEYGEKYSIVREQGLTMYVSDSNAVWVNVGVMYKIETTIGSLTKKQINTIATSL